MRKLTITDHSGNLTLEWPWKAKGNMFLMGFSIFWNAIVLFIVGGLLIQDGFNIITLLPVSIHLIIGVALFYSALARQMNRTTLTVNKQQLSVDIGPLPWFGKKQIKSGDLEQLYVIEAGSETTGNRKTILYSIHAILKNKKKITLVRGIRDRERGLEIEKLIEEHLGIQDVPVESGYNELEEKFKKYFPNKPVPPLPGPINDKHNRAEKEEAHRRVTGFPSATDFPSANGTPAPSGGPAPPPREVPIDLTDPLANGTGAVMSLRSLNYELNNVTQFDWENDTIDRSGELSGTTEETGFYSEDRGTRTRYYFEERDLSPKEFLRIGLGNIDNMPQQFTNGDEKYHLRETVSGYAYPAGRDGYPVRQWLYFTTSSHTRFRVLENGGHVKVYIQEPVALKELA